MNARSWVTVATFAVSLTVVAIILIIAPGQHWSADSVTSLVLLYAGFVQLVLVRHSTVTRGDSGPAIASLGTSVLLTFALLTITGFALFVGLNGHNRMCWALNIFAVGVFILGFSLMKATSAIVGTSVASPASSQPSHWTQLLESMKPLVKKDDMRAQLARLSESVRYAASNPRGLVVPENETINVSLSRLASAIASDDREKTHAEAIHLETTLMQREAALKALRTHA
ncbi:hypothetical protein ABNK63_00555 [Rhodanobacter sp. IGA1.0]|uniref:Uncharacterized protein n=1 Tax=Rhodanobacter sp. IGA1.0 TaxID=3158582 RepID=A0AAU7QL03_9GAMM